MKRVLVLFLGVSLILGATPLRFVKAYSTSDKLKGRILLQVESNGEAWYVNPKDGKGYYMADGDRAYDIMRNLGVGIKNSDLDTLKKSKTAALKHKGKIFLQVESKGEAYYVDFSGSLNYLKNGSEAYNLMRKLGLGIKNKDLDTINKSDISNNATSKNSLSSEDNYAFRLFVLYKDKIKLIDKAISALNLYKFVDELNAKDEKDYIAFANKTTSESGYDTSFGKNIWQLELNEDLRLIDAYQSSINELKTIKTKLEEKLVSINNGEITITKAEFLLQKNIIDSNIKEDTAEVINKSITSTRFFTAAKRDVLHEQIVSAAKKDLAEIQQQLIDIENEKAKTPIVIISPVAKAPSVMPRINCQTMKTLSGSRTICTEELTMNSYTCNSSKDVYGNRNESCYPTISNIR